MATLAIRGTEVVPMPALIAMSAAVVGAVTDPSDAASVRKALREAFGMLGDLVEDARREKLADRDRERARIAATETVGVALLELFKAFPNVSRKQLGREMDDVIRSARDWAMQGDERFDPIQ